MEPFKEKIASFKSTWKQLEPLISESFIPILKLEVANKTPKELLQKVVETMESKGYNDNIYDEERVLVLKPAWHLRAFLDSL